jgi:hypothetical protein
VRSCPFLNDPQRRRALDLDPASHATRCDTAVADRPCEGVVEFDIGLADFSHAWNASKLATNRVIRNAVLAVASPAPIREYVPMSAFSATQISKPTDEQTFERACLVLFRCLLSDPNIQFNAKRGQGQHGVDIFGFRNEDTTRPAGIQCKLKTDGKRLTGEGGARRNYQGFRISTATPRIFHRYDRVG